MKNSKASAIKNQSEVTLKAKLVESIKDQLVENLGWQDKTSQFVGNMIGSLLSMSGVWHKKLAHAMQTNNQADSDIRAIQRFLANPRIDYPRFYRMIYSALRFNKKITIVIDRTNWDYGKTHINILVATVLVSSYDGTQEFAVPIAWEVFDKKGNSNTQERKNLMRHVLNIVGRENIDSILADREFIGEEWIMFLHENSIPFILRTRRNLIVEYNGKKRHIWGLFMGLKSGEFRTYTVKLGGIFVTLSGTLSPDNELVAVIASQNIKDNPLSAYRLRWLIELFFKSIKTQGFHIEETHMTHPERIKALFALIAYATALSVNFGKLRDRVKKIRIKKHGRPSYSLFTYGLDLIKTLFRGTIPSYLRAVFESCNLAFLSLTTFEEKALSYE